MKSLLLILTACALVAFGASRLAPNLLFSIELSLDHAPAALPMPVAGASAKSLYDSWGAPRDRGARRHEGIDIFARRGTPVQSTTRGIVWSVGRNGLGGNVVFVLGPGHELHYYAHLDRFAEVH